MAEGIRTLENYYLTTPEATALEQLADIQKDLRRIPMVELNVPTVVLVGGDDDHRIVMNVDEMMMLGYFYHHTSIIYHHHSIVIQLSSIIITAPNVGKSSIVRAVSSGTPEVNDYPFTTRELTDDDDDD